jgi:hypothetical protein
MANGNGIILKVAATVVGILTLVALAITSTLASERTRERDVSKTQVERIVLVLDAMKQVDTDLATQIAAVKGSNDTSVQLINQRIDTVATLLQDIKAILKGKP